MPHDHTNILSNKGIKGGLRLSLNRGRNQQDVENYSSNFLSCKADGEGDSILPFSLRNKLYELFNQIEKEFETIYAENLILQEKVYGMRDKCDAHKSDGEIENISASQKFLPTQKLKVQTSKIVSSFKTPALSCIPIKKYYGHKDGIWDISASHQGILGSASLGTLNTNLYKYFDWILDHAASLWNVDSGNCLLQYTGHQGSVNSIHFHPINYDLVLTGSGDHRAHIWKAAINTEQIRNQPNDGDVENTEILDEEKSTISPILRTPSLNLIGHSGPVSSSIWLQSGDGILTASWDRTAMLWDVTTGELIQTLLGHDQELTYCCAHPVANQLAVTASKDTTFRLWDFRDSVQQVSVFQGHSDNVTCAIITNEDKIVSGSDDRSCKVWDLRNMYSPQVAIRVDSSVNRLSVSNQRIIALPHDNRHIRLFDMKGQHLARLPHSNHFGHKRMVSATCWAYDNATTKANLFSCGFDKIILGWHVAL